MKPKVGCPLCERRSYTVKYYEDEHFWVVKTLDQDKARWRIMCAMKAHIEEPNQAVVLRAKLVLCTVADRFVPALGDYTLEKKMRTVRDHWHIHARWA